MAGRLVKPMLAESVEVDDLGRFLSDDGWIVEQKIDGHRVAMHVIDGVPYPVNRRGEEFKQRMSDAVIADFDSKFEGLWVLDGELLGNVYHIFDLPLLIRNGTEIINTDTPFRERREALELLFNSWHPTACRLVKQAVTTKQKEDLVEAVRRNDGEGVMLKELDGRYFPGSRSYRMYKAKFTATIEVVVTDLMREGKRNAGMGLVDNGFTLDVGTVTMSDRNLERVKVGDVVEIKYLYCGAGGKLFQPRFLRLRNDKAQDECTTDQLKHVNKAVL